MICQVELVKDLMEIRQWLDAMSSSMFSQRTARNTRDLMDTLIKKVLEGANDIHQS